MNALNGRVMSDKKQLSNNPPITIELSHDLAKFLVDNCSSNLDMTLKMLQAIHDGQDVSDGYVEKVIALNENFMAIKRLVENALDNGK